MNPKYLKILKDLIEKVDVVLYVLDARYIDYTYSEKWVQYIRNKQKKIIFVVNKVDLLSREEEDQIKERLDKFFTDPYVLFSAKKYWNVNVLRKKIKESVNKQIINACVLGYSNVGKSSVISALKGKGSAKVSSFAGFTKGIQRIKIDNQIYLWDAPGVDLEIEDENILAILGARNPEDLKDSITPAEIVLKRFGISLQEYAKRMNFLRKGTELDLDRASKDVLRRNFDNTLQDIINRIMKKDDQNLN
ncbi:MAG: GTPase [Candidatus Woesearchaeota archaeon]